MRSLIRAWLLLMGLGLFVCQCAVAQRNDTVRVDETADSSVAPPQDSSQNAADSMTGGKEATDGHAEAPVLRTIADSATRKWSTDAAYAYANDPGYWTEREVRYRNPDSWLARLLGSKLTEYFLLFLLGGILLYAIVRIIADNNLQLFYRSPRRRSGRANPGVEPSPIEDDLDERLQRALQAGDFRQAVRFLYLKSLRLLDDRGLIRYHQESTNLEYLRQLSGRPQGVPFRNLTTIYEKVWYGEFPLGEPVFQRLQHYFEEFYKTVRA